MSDKHTTGSRTSAQAPRPSYPRLTDRVYQHSTGKYTQEQVARTAQHLALGYGGYDKTGSARLAHIRAAAFTAGTNWLLAKDVAEWVGCYIDAAHDAEVRAARYQPFDWWLDWAYDMLH